MNNYATPTEPTMDERLDRLNELMMKAEIKLNRIAKSSQINRQKNIFAKKNHPLHLLVEKDLIESLRVEAKENKISVGELCRRKLRGNSQLDRIEMKIDKIIK